jgi:hypothetical protein
MDKTKTGQVFEYIRTHGASTIGQIEQALKFDAYICVHSMKHREILFSTMVEGSNEQIFEVLPRTTHLVTNVKTPKKRLAELRKYNSHPRQLIKVVCDKEHASVFKYAVGARNSRTNGRTTTMKFEHSRPNLKAIKSIAKNINSDGFNVSVSRLDKKVGYKSTLLI